MIIKKKDTGVQIILSDTEAKKMPAGASHWNSKLTEKKRDKIRHLYGLGTFTMTELAKIYKVSSRTISNVIHRGK